MVTIIKKDIVAIENIQRRATKLVKDLSSLSYEQRILKLGIPTLIYRRERADMIQLYKIMNECDQAELHSITLTNDSCARGHKHKLVKRHYKYKTYMKNFTARSINPWNSLLSECITSETVNSFKSNINNAWKHKANKFYYNF